MSTLRRASTSRSPSVERKLPAGFEMVPYRVDPPGKGPGSASTGGVRLSARGLNRQGIVTTQGGPRQGRKRNKNKNRGGNGRGGITIADAWAKAQQAWNMVRWVKGLINVEQKYFDTNGTLNESYTGSIVNLSNIVQGDDVTQRTGDSILLRRIEFKAFFSPGGTAAKNLFRVIIFRDMQQDGTDPTPAQLLETTGGNNAPISPLTYFYADGNGRIERFKVLADETFELVTTTYNIRMMKYDRRFGDGAHHIWYDATAAADASNREGALYALFISDNTGAGNTVSGYWYNRITFTDN